MRVATNDGPSWETPVTSCLANYMLHDSSLRFRWAKMENDSWHVVGPNYPLNKWKYHWCCVLNPYTGIQVYPYTGSNKAQWQLFGSWNRMQAFPTVWFVMSILRGDTHTCVFKAYFWSADLFWQDNTISYCWLTWHIVNTRVLGAGVTNANSVAVWKVFVLFYMKSRTWITRTHSEWIQENTISQTQNGREKKKSPVEFTGATSTLRHKKISVTASKYFDCYRQAHTKMLHILF